MKIDESVIERIIKSAQEHENRYLLPRLRLDNEAEWTACEVLVLRNKAIWIPRSSNFYPGIELNGELVK